MPFTRASGPVIVPHTQTLIASAARAGVVAASNVTSRARLIDLLMVTSWRGDIRLCDEGSCTAPGHERRDPVSEPAQQRREAARLEEQEENDEQAERHL